MSDGLSAIEIQRVIARMDATIKDMILQRDALAGLLPQQKTIKREYDWGKFKNPRGRK